MTLSVDDVRAFIRSNHRGVLATTRRDGGPQMSPVSVGVDDDGSLLISTRETAMKTVNVRRTGRASVCAFEDAFLLVHTIFHEKQHTGQVWNIRDELRLLQGWVTHHSTRCSSTTTCRAPS